MISLHLSEEEITDLEEALDSPEVCERAKKKLLVITMQHEGATHGFIARCLLISAGTLTSYLKEYRDGGLPAVVEKRYYKQCSSLAPFLSCIKCSFKAFPVANAKEAVARIAAMAGVTLSESQVRRVMKKMGMSLKKCANMPTKADPQLRLEFYTTELKPRLQQAIQG